MSTRPRAERDGQPPLLGRRQKPGQVNGAVGDLARPADGERVGIEECHGAPGGGRSRHARQGGSGERSDGLGERFGEVAVLTFTEAVPAHVDGRPEPAVVGVESGDLGGLLSREQRAGQLDVVALGARVFRVGLMLPPPG
jgi:hypothetical protein